ncbi:MAG: helix-turn-helix domain-containing protein [Lachnospiraceae bacterium]|nr:helix-turn-helix domain-containing protein [Lachnospiraceae bacterium]
MVSNQILQSTIDGLTSITQKELTVLEPEGDLLATTESSKAAREIVLPGDFEDGAVVDGHQLFSVSAGGDVEYILAVKGTDEASASVGRIAVFQLQGLMVAYKERYDKDNFVKNLLLDNLLLVDIYMRAKKLHIDNNVARVIYLIESDNDKDVNDSVIDIIRGIYPTKNRDFITAIDERNIILVKDVTADTSRIALEKTAMTISDMLSAEAMGRVRIALGSVVTDLKDISRSYKEAKIALEVGKIFYEDKGVINYNRLGIGRLIYQLPMSLCKMYIEEIFKDVKVEDFDEETLNTVSKFFENSLNISETSRQLYIHRNTLVYRLDKLQKNTGLDVRTFDDAIIFKIALMVAKYMDYMESNGFR